MDFGLRFTHDRVNVMVKKKDCFSIGLGNFKLCVNSRVISSLRRVAVQSWVSKILRPISFSTLISGIPFTLK